MYFLKCVGAFFRQKSVQLQAQFYFAQVERERNEGTGGMKKCGPLNLGDEKLKLTLDLRHWTSVQRGREGERNRKRHFTLCR